MGARYGYCYNCAPPCLNGSDMNYSHAMKVVLGVEIVDVLVVSGIMFQMLTILVLLT